jgi:hypothetical protein
MGDCYAFVKLFERDAQTKSYNKRHRLDLGSYRRADLTWHPLYGTYVSDGPDPVEDYHDV